MTLSGLASKAILESREKTVLIPLLVDDPLRVYEVKFAEVKASKS